jgi:phosphopantetheinyl transferase
MRACHSRLPCPLAVVVARDLKQPTGALTSRLSLKERQQAEAQPTEPGCRRFALGRLAAHAAARKMLVRQLRAHEEDPVIEVLVGAGGEPLLSIDGAMNRLGISISHSSRLAVACVWRVGQTGDYHAGIDLERERPTELAESPFAFTLSERRWLARLQGDSMRAGLAAWTVKEAAWKALYFQQPVSPAEVQINRFDLARGTALAGTKGRGMNCSRRFIARVCVRTIEGPDGRYLLSIAETMACGSWSRNMGTGHPPCRTQPSGAWRHTWAAGVTLREVSE